MGSSCEKIISENEKLKLSDLEKSSKNIFEYLNLHHNINFLKIKVISKNSEDTIFNNLDEEKIFISQLSFKQNNDTNVIFLFFASDKLNYDLILSDIENIKMALQIFSQSLYNKYMEKSITQLSLTDHLTGAYNRCYLNHYIGNILSLALREEKKIAFLKVSIDQFKAVIDEFDYEIGDKVLISLSKTLKSSIRETDLVVKISNDEFLMILHNVINENNATIVAEKIIDNFSQEKVIVNDNTKQFLKKSICVGIAMYPDNALNLDDLLKKSDIALYEAKNMGRGKVLIYNKQEAQTIDFF